MTGRSLVAFLALLLACHAANAGTAAVSSGSHWQVAIDRLDCEAAAARIHVGLRIRYLGPPGIVEAPVNRLVDGGGKSYPPLSLIWRGGSKPFAAWMAAGGMTTLQAGAEAEVQFRFEVGEGGKALALEFGDLPAVALTRAGAAEQAGVCSHVLKPGEVRASRRPGPARASGARLGTRVYRGSYPCLPPSGALRTVEALHPPYLPEQLLVFGRGYLPNARQVDLPMGKANAQSYAYAGLDQLGAYEDAARQALAADFPALAGGLAGRPKYFAFNWGAQKADSGNEVVSIGVYALRACPS